jgi:tRNA-Thr(GGU) m(6)t(6)A37 methyltransferase TsaA
VILWSNLDFQFGLTVAMSWYAAVRQIGVIRSTLKTRLEAPRQGCEGAPDAWLEIRASVADGLEGIEVGDEIVIVTWLHRARRDVLRVRPRGDRRRRLTGVFATRSPDRPNPLGLHPVKVKAIDGLRLRVGPIEAIDGTPVVDVKAPFCGRRRTRCPKDRAIRRTSR